MRSETRMGINALLAGFAGAAMWSGAAWAEPVQLSAEAMDRVTAGAFTQTSVTVAGTGNPAFALTDSSSRAKALPYGASVSFSLAKGASYGTAGSSGSQDGVAAGDVNRTWGTVLTVDVKGWGSATFAWSAALALENSRLSVND